MSKVAAATTASTILPLLPREQPDRREVTMARYGCSECGEEGEFDCWAWRRKCPRCRSHNVRLIFSVSELPDDHPLKSILRLLSEEEKE